MNREPETHWSQEQEDFINALGGNTAVANYLTSKQNRIKPYRSNTIYFWKKRRGIPWRHRRDLAELAAILHVALPPGFLDFPPLKPRRSSAEAKPWRPKEHRPEARIPWL